MRRSDKSMDSKGDIKLENAMKDAQEAIFPTYRFHYPRPAYQIDPSPFFDFGPSDTDEAIVTNGTLSASMAPNGQHTGYWPSQLRRFNAPPFTLGEKDESPIFHIWGYDELGHHQVNNIAFSMDFSLKGLRSRVDHVEYDGKTNPNWAVDFEHNAIPLKRVIVSTVTYTNRSGENRLLKIAGHMRNPQITYSLGWTQRTPVSGSVSAQYNPTTGYGAVETSSTDNKAHLVFGFNKAPESYAVTTSDEAPKWCDNGFFSGSDVVSDVEEHNQYMSYSFGTVAPGQSVSLSMIIAISDTISKARADYIDTATQLPTRLNEATEYWNERWDETKFEIQTPEESINRMSEIAMSNGILGLDPVNEAWITSFGRSFRGVTFIWDQNYSNYGYLTGGRRSLVKQALISSLNLDLTSYNFYGLTTKNSLGYHYAYSHYSITSLVYKYVTLTGDTDFLQEQLNNGQSVIENLSSQVKYIAYGLAFDFGETWELLECVENYVKDIPDLTANTCWMADKIKAMASIIGRNDIADVMGSIWLDAYNKLQTMWDANAGWFTTHQGKLSYSCQVMLSILSGVLSQEQIDGLTAKMGDFVGPLGVKSLASYDEEFVAESRGDFNGPAAFTGIPVEFANILGSVGARKELYNLTKGVSRWWEWRPFQPQGIDSETGYGVGLISFVGTNNCASAYMSIVPMYMVGIRPAIGGMDMNDCYPADWTNSRGNANFNGKRYSTKISLPHQNRKYTFYVDKPDAGDGRYSHATIYSKEGELIKEWHAQRLPEMDQDSHIVLHFDSSEPLLTRLDEITRVWDATVNNYSLENAYSDLQFTVRRSGSGDVSCAIKGAANGNYHLYINDKKHCPAMTADEKGNFAFSYTMTNDSDRIRILYVPADISDLALGRMVTADSALNDECKPNRIVDGKDETGWVSAKSQLPHWAAIDLDAIQSIRRVDIHWGADYGIDYKVQISPDGVDWSLVAHVSGNDSSGLKTYTFSPAEARYVRIYTARGSSGNIRIHNIHVY